MQAHVICWSVDVTSGPNSRPDCMFTEQRNAIQHIGIPPVWRTSWVPSRCQPERSYIHAIRNVVINTNSLYTTVHSEDFLCLRSEVTGRGTSQQWTVLMKLAASFLDSVDLQGWISVSKCVSSLEITLVKSHPQLAVQTRLIISHTGLALTLLLFVHCDQYRFRVTKMIVFTVGSLHVQHPPLKSHDCTYGNSHSIHALEGCKSTNASCLN